VRGFLANNEHTSKFSRLVQQEFLDVHELPAYGNHDAMHALDVKGLEREQACPWLDFHVSVKQWQLRGGGWCFRMETAHNLHFEESECVE
jgi:hypothetical protein